MKIVLIVLICAGVALSTLVPRAKRQNAPFNIPGLENISISGGCVTYNGYIYQNGVSRPVTENEKRLLKQYEDAMKQWNIDFQAYMQSQFPPGFPFNKNPAPKRNPPTTPVFPPGICAGQGK